MYFAITGLTGTWLLTYARPEVVVGEDFEFFYCVRIGIDDGVVAEEVVVVGAVDQEADGFRALPADRKEVAAAVVFIRWEDARLQKAELEGIAFDEREIENSTLRLYAAESCADGIDLGDIAGDFDYFFKFSGLQSDVEFGILVDIQHDAAMHVFAETLPLGRNSIVADGDQREGVRPATIGLHRLRHVGFRVGEGYGDTGDYGAGGIFQCPGDVGGDFSGVEKGRKSSSQKENETREAG